VLLLGTNNIDMIGMLREILNYQAERNSWFELDNQVMLSQHPKQFHHLVHICKLKPMDISRMAPASLHEFLLWPYLWLVGVSTHQKRPDVRVGICISLQLLLQYLQAFTALPILYSLWIFCLYQHIFVLCRSGINTLNPKANNIPKYNLE